jgi:hypothetical protein
LGLRSSIGSHENLLGIAYLAIALGLVGNAVYFTEVNTQWLRASTQLETNIQGVKFDLQRGTANITATLNNPSEVGGIALLTIGYSVFVNSTQASFSYAQSAVVATREVNYQKQIPARSNLNISTSLPLMVDVIPSLTKFLQTYQSTLIIYVGTDMQVESSYIIPILTSCIELPSQTATLCPPLRPAVGGGGGA